MPSAPPKPPDEPVDSKKKDPEKPPTDPKKCNFTIIPDAEITWLPTNNIEIAGD